MENCTVEGRKHKNSGPGIELGAQGPGHQQAPGQPQHREQHERGGEHQQVQPPLLVGPSRA